MSVRFAAILVAAAALWPAPGAAQVKFNPSPPPAPPPVFVTGPSSVIQTMYKPVNKPNDAKHAKSAASPNNLSAIGIRLAEVMKDALKNSGAESAVEGRTQPAARTRGGTTTGRSTPSASKLVEIAAGESLADVPAVPATEGRVRLRWSDRIELKWPDVDAPEAASPGDRVPLIWR